ncbi:hypothetical protein [Pseudonocardia sp.]|uniref:hypothetical protein n=1 Tax=Pseudonocardia sp. TaxID=60912 RepID=UPI003D0CD2C8
MSVTDLPTPRDHTVADSAYEGAGFVSSWYDLGEAVAGGDPGEIAWAMNGAALDSLGVAMDPLDALASAGVGWLIEHVAFLHEPLDALAGDPIRIEDEARTWTAVATRMVEVAGQHVRSLDALTGWTGAAADAYRETAGAFTFGLERGADLADVAASEVLSSGADIATVRALVRDAVAGFVADVLVAAAVAGVTAVVSGGGSVAGFVLWVVRGAVETAAGIARSVAQLLDRLGASATRLATAASRLDDIARQARRFDTPEVRALDTAVDAGAPVVEYGKNHTAPDWQPAR